MSQTKLNYGAIFLYGLLISTIIVAVLYFLNVEPVHSSVTSIVKSLKLDGGLTSLVTLAKNNLSTIAAIGIPAGIALVTYVSKQKAQSQVAKLQDDYTTIQNEKKSLTKQVTDAQQTLANTQINHADQLKNLQDKIDGFDSDGTIAELQQNFLQVKNEKTNLEGQLKSALDQNQALMNKLATQGQKTVVEKMIA